MSRKALSTHKHGAHQRPVLPGSTYALLVSRAYMEKEIPTGAQDVFGEMEYTVPTQLPPYCDNAAWNYYFSSFWNYRDIGCVPPTSLEVLVPGTNEIFVITEVEEHVTVKKNCTATNCDVQDDVTNTFIIDPEVAKQCCSSSLAPAHPVPSPRTRCMYRFIMRTKPLGAPPSLTLPPSLWQLTAPC